MTISAHPNQRFGDHVVLTVTLPAHFVVLTHHGKDVKIDVDVLRKFATREGEDPHEYRYQPIGFSWREEVTLREQGWAVVLSSGMLWPTRSLVSAVQEWNRQMGIG